MRILFSFVVVVLLGISPALSASFNCERAESKVEKLICSDTALSLLDEQMGTLYRKAAQALSDKDNLRKEQGIWLKAVRDICDTTECLKSEYEKRNAKLLESLTSQNVKPNEVSKYIGRYRKQHTVGCFREAPNGEDAWTSCETADDLIIGEKSDGNYEISIEVIGTNFHECSTSGTAILKGNALEHQYEDCSLILQLEPDGVLLIDRNARNCFCGMRASLRDVKFYLSEKTENPRKAQ